MKRHAAMMVLGLWMSACDSGPNENADNASLAAANQAVTNASAAPVEAKLDPCPFQETRDWHAFVEGGQLKVNGKVDLLMAGFKPVLSRRDASGSGAVAFDLSLVQEAGAAVSDKVRYSGSDAGGAGSAEIYCDGKQVAKVELIRL